MKGATCCVLLLLSLAGLCRAAAGIDFDKLGFDKKEGAALKWLGVTSVDDITYLQSADLAKLTDMTAVAMRRLEYKVRGIRAVQVINSTDITGICAEMAANRHNRDVAVAGAKALVRQILRYKHSTYRIEQIAKAPEGAVFTLVRAMEIHFDEPDVVEATVHGLHLLAFTDNTKSKIGQSGGVDAVIIALTRHGDQPTLMQYALRLLAKVVFNENIKKSLGTDANIDTILKSINLHKYNPTYLDEACMALWSITSPSQYCLHLAAQRGMVDVVKSILEVGGEKAASTKAQDTGKTALHVAALHGKTEVVETLIKFWEGTQEGSGPMLEQIDEEFRATALHMAAATGKKDVVALLIAKGGERLIDAIEGFTAKTPFMVAIERGQVEVCDYLVTRIGRGVASAIDATRNSAMHLAGGEGMVESVKWLMQFEEFRTLYGGLNDNGMTAKSLADINNNYVVGKIIGDWINTKTAESKTAE
uniref:Uncharacterized protein n=1 Tax=Hemiselmis andersenii TaxID=464988 RepID=A0A6U4WJM1_HEMAN|mmetsp:Transcript_333/g.751  ORF Transcript_333/g.751 Transcript_333/m.751 type:complete len:476 (-) Transcript_333:145-1572(-)